MSKQKFAELTEDQQRFLVELGQTMGVVPATEARQESPKVIIDRYALQKLFWNTKFREGKPSKKMPRLIVRCDRDKKIWSVTVEGGSGKQHFKSECVLSGVQMVSKTGLETVKEEKYIGCGTHRTVSIDVYSGFAVGTFTNLPAREPSGGRKLKYDRDEGVFRDSCSGEIVKEAAYLVLMENCTHAYVPMPDKPKGKK